jgi:hypothetical protein
MVEFSIVFLLFLVCLLATIQAGFWALDNMAAVTAVENGTRIAALPLQPSEGGNPASETPAGATGVDAKVVSELRAGMVSTPVVVWNMQWDAQMPQQIGGPAATGCPTSETWVLWAEADGLIPATGAAVAICSTYFPSGSTMAIADCPQSATGCVQVVVVGYARLLVTTSIVVLGLGQHCVLALPHLGMRGASGQFCTQGFPIFDEATVPAETYTQ